MKQTTTAVIALLFATAHPGIQAQSSPTFEVASVKRNMSDDAPSRSQVPPSGTVSIVDASLTMLITTAYQVDPAMERFLIVVASQNPLIREPGSINDFLSLPRFDIQGKVPDGAAPGQQLAMLRTLLEERFKLRTHRERRSIPVYALTVARQDQLGPNLRRSSADCDAFFAGRAKNKELTPPVAGDGQRLCTREFEVSGGAVRGVRSAGTIPSIIGRIQSFVDRPIVDATALAGTFEWALSINLTASAGEVAAPSIFTALQEQLGLRLERRRETIEVLVIDSVEMPSEN